MTRGTAAPGTLRFRHGIEADIEQLKSLLGACIDAMRADGIDQWDEEYPASSSVISDIQARALYVATLADDAMVGSFVLDDRQEPEYAAVNWAIHGARIAVVHRLMVRPDFQGRGVAKGLMRFAEQKASKLGFEAIRLDAFISNPGALRLYAGLGYQFAGTVKFRKGAFQCFEKAL